MVASNTCYCSFCGKSEYEVKCIVAGPTVFICDECVALCNGIIAKHTHVPRVMRASDLGIHEHWSTNDHSTQSGTAPTTDDHQGAD